MNYPADFTGLVMAPRGISSAITMAFVPKLSKYFNTKYGRTGSLFEGSFKAKLIVDENYLKYI